MNNEASEDNKKEPDEGVPQGFVGADTGDLRADDAITRQSHSAQKGVPSNPSPPVSIQLGRIGRLWSALSNAESTNRVIMFATVIIALAAVAQGVFVRLQWREMVGSGVQTDKIIAAADEIKRALITANQQNADAVKNTLAQNQEQFASTLAEMRKQSGAVQNSAEAEKVAAGASKESVEQTRTTLHVSERAYLTVSGPTLDFDKGVVALSVSNSGRIPSGDAEIVVHEATINPANSAAEPDLNAAVERHWRRNRFESVAPGTPFGIVVPIPSFSKAKVEAATQTIILAGQVSYNDGFPDDPLQQWPFCTQSVRHFVLKQTIWVPCDGRVVLPQMQRLDGYPNNEQAN